MRRILLFVGIGIGLLIIANESKAQKSVSMYGKVTTVSGDKYTGAIRWGTDNSQKAEVFWVELFNGTKTSNDFLRFLTKSEVQELSGKEEGDSWLSLDLGVLSIWEDKFSRTQHEFKSRFGDIKSIEPLRRDRAKVTLKNGAVLEIAGGNSEDLGGSIGVLDFELGEVKLSWGRIDKVEFMAAPKGYKETFGEPIYGIVNAGRKGTFKGLIEWDSDERFMDEILDGKDRDGDKKVPFRSIQKIEKNRNGVDLTLRSGRTLYLTGSNDVNDGNRGILIHGPEVGQVKVPWRDFIDLEINDDESLGMSYDDFPVSKGINATVITIQGDEFKKVTFSDAPSGAIAYSTFSDMKKLSGTVTTTDGKTLSGNIIYDLDETYTFEMLQGKDDDVEYIISMGNIKSISPKNYDYSTVVLKNGTELLLGDARDVNEDNDGVLVFTGSGDPEYIRWEDIKNITFN